MREVTYLLTNGGHNAGIVSEPGHQGRRYRVITKTIDQPYLDPDGFLERAAQKDGSWWPEWSDWLSENSGASGHATDNGRAAIRLRHARRGARHLRAYQLRR